MVNALWHYSLYLGLGITGAFILFLVLYVLEWITKDLEPLPKGIILASFFSFLILSFGFMLAKLLGLQ